MATKPLSPTLWRTCRVLNGDKRLRLLQHILIRPGQNVSALAEQIGIGVSDASQELRRLQSRGLIRRMCRGRSVLYLPAADPLVPSAGPLLRTLKSLLRPESAELADIAAIAKGLACERRISLVRQLQAQPCPTTHLARQSGTSLATLKTHLRILKATGWIETTDRVHRIRPSAHPLRRLLLGLV